jgi:hypothetical protein
LVDLIPNKVYGQLATRAEDPSPVPYVPRCREPQQAADDRERRLHHEAALVGRLLLDQQRAIVDVKERRLLACAGDPNGGELAKTERLFLRAPEQRKVDPSGEGHDGQIRGLAAFNNRLDHPW